MLRSTIPLAFSCLLLLHPLLQLGTAVSAQEAVGQTRLANVLIYSATTGWRHDSIPTAIQALKTGGPSIDVRFEDTEDAARFTDEGLAEYDALLFLSTTGDVLSAVNTAALRNYLNLGGNFIGVHSASDTLRNTTFYVREIGARFDYHADLQEASVLVTGPSNPITAGLPSPWVVEDEWYYFDADPRSLGAEVILTVDESTFMNTGRPRYDHGSPHPIAWIQESGAGAEGDQAGRSFYTSLGHLNETWEDPVFLGHVLRGIRWALESNTTRAFNLAGSVGNPTADPEFRAFSSAEPSASTMEGQSGPAPSGSGSNSEPSDAFSVLPGMVSCILAVVGVVVMCFA